MDQVQSLIGEINKKFGDGTIMRASELADQKIERLPTGIFTLDLATRGGLPAGRVTLLTGREGSLKTTLSLLIAKLCQRLCGDCLKEKCSCKKQRPMMVGFIDAENKYPSELARAIGVDESKIIVTRPESAEQAIDVADVLLRNEGVGLVIVDSIAAFVPMAEVEKSMEEWQQGLAAREVNKFCRRILAALSSRSKLGRSPTVILINQVRQKLGIAYGDPTTFPGGEGQKFTASLIVKMWAKKYKDYDPAKDGDSPPKVQVGFSILKHSFGPGHTDGEFIVAMRETDGLRSGESDEAEIILRYAQSRGLVNIERGKAAAMGQEFSSLRAVREDRKILGKLRAKLLTDMEGK